MAMSTQQAIDLQGHVASPEPYLTSHAIITTLYPIGGREVLSRVWVDAEGVPVPGLPPVPVDVYSADQRKYGQACVVCGKRFTSKQPTALYCGVDCMDTARNLRRYGETRYCEWCAAPMRYKKRQRRVRYCSSECREAKRQYRRELERAQASQRSRRSRR